MSDDMDAIRARLRKKHPSDDCYACRNRIDCDTLALLEENERLEKLANLSIERLAEATEPGAIGAFAARDVAKAEVARLTAEVERRCHCARQGETIIHECQIHAEARLRWAGKLLERAEQAEAALAAKQDDCLRARRLAHGLTLDTQTCEEMVVALIERQGRVLAAANERAEARVWADGKNADAAACRDLLSRTAEEKPLPLGTPIIEACRELPLGHEFQRHWPVDDADNCICPEACHYPSCVYVESSHKPKEGA